MRRIALLVLALSALAALASTLAAGGGRSFPDRIDLPSGFAPEGIDIDHKGTFYVGSIPTGAIYSGIRTGRGSILVPRARRAGDRRGREPRRLFVAGGPPAAPSSTTPGTDARSPRTSSTLPTFVNDVVVARGGAYFTDFPEPGALPDPDRSPRPAGVPVGDPSTGDIAYIAGFNANGIDAARHGRRS